MSLRVNLLGRLQVESGGRPVVIRRRKARALLAYLCMAPGQRASRDVLAALLWGERDEGRARGSLRQELLVLRRALDACVPGALHNEGDTVGVRVEDGAVEIDVGRFEGLCGATSVSAWSAAVALYAGDFLQDLSVPEAPYEEWRDAERVRLRQLLTDALDRLGIAELESGDIEGALARARRLVYLDPLRESGHRLLMRALARSGQRTAAMAQYRECKRLLGEALRVAPDAETVRVFDEIARPSEFAGLAASLNNDPAMPLRGAVPGMAGSAASALEVEALHPERRQLSVMRCALVAAPRLSASGDVEAFRERLLRHTAVASEVIERHGGSVARRTGNGLLACFGYPHAHEDDAERAVRAAIEVREALTGCESGDAASAEDPDRHGRAVCIGIATGPAVIDARCGAAGPGDAMIGDILSQAERLERAAAPAGVMVSAATAELAGATLQAEPVVLDAQQTAHRVHGLADGVSRFSVRIARQLTPFVGREEELEALARRWRRVREGQGQCVLVMGEAGIGKSRLVAEFGDGLSLDPGRHVLLQCSPHHTSSALWPVITAFARVLGLGEGTSQGAAMAALERHLQALELADAQTVGLLAHMLSIAEVGTFPGVEAMDARLRREKTLQRLLDWMRCATRNGAAVWTFEDIHWADPTTLELLARAAAALDADPVLVIATARAPFNASWMDAPDVGVLALGRLSRKASERLASAAAQPGTGLSGEALAAISRRASGNPLFVEELSRMMSSPDFRPAPPPDPIPGTLSAFLMSRLDDLGAGRLVAQWGSVLGRDFSEVLLREVWAHSPVALDAGLAELVAHQVIHAREEDGHTRYRFKHALIEDAAYESMLQGTRQSIHLEVAANLEAVPEIASSQPELLARHLALGGAIEPAITHYLRAGERAASQFANPEALEHFDSALELIESLPETDERLSQRLDALLWKGSVNMRMTGWGAPAGREAYLQAREIVGQLPSLDPRRYFLLNEGLRQAYGHRAELDLAEEAARDGLNHARRNGIECADESDPPTILHAALYGLGFTLAQQGRFRDALELYQRGTPLTPLREANPRRARVGGSGVNHAGCTIVLWTLGYPDQARAYRRELLQLQRRMSEPFYRAYYLFIAAMLAQKLGNHDSVRRHVAEGRAIAEENHVDLLLGWADVLEGWVRACGERAPEGCEQLARGIEATRASGSLSYSTYFDTLLAESFLSVGEQKAGLAAVSDSIRFEASTGMRESAAESRRIQAGLFKLDGEPPSRIESCLQEAIDIASAQQARSLELRATLALVRFLAGAGDPAPALVRLRTLYDRFSEGHDTADLIEARQVLDRGPAAFADGPPAAPGMQ